MAAWLQRLLAPASAAPAGGGVPAPAGGAPAPASPLFTLAATATACVRLGARHAALSLSAQSTAVLCGLACCVGLMAYPLVALFVAQTNRALARLFAGAPVGAGGAYGGGGYGVYSGYGDGPLPAELDVLAALADGVGPRGGFGSQLARWLRRAGSGGATDGGAAGGPACAANALAVAEVAESVARIGALQRQLVAEVADLVRAVHELQQ